MRRDVQNIDLKAVSDGQTNLPSWMWMSGSECAEFCSQAQREHFRSGHRLLMCCTSLILRQLRERLDQSQSAAAQDDQAVAMHVLLPIR